MIDLYTGKIITTKADIWVCYIFLMVFTSFYVGLDARNLVLAVWEKQGRRPACTFAQSDQRCCSLLIIKHPIEPCY